MCNDFTPTLLNALGIHNSVTGEKGAANGALDKMAIGRLLDSASTPQDKTGYVGQGYVGPLGMNLIVPRRIC